MKCHYCNEFGHFIRECLKRIEDEKNARHFSGMNADYFADKVYSDDYAETYDEEVFVTLNN